MRSWSNNQINKAGKVLRRWGQGDLCSEEEVQWARTLLLDFRAAHRVPLTKATMGLRSIVQTEGCKLEVSQRLKRIPKIVDKLVQEPSMALSSMQDVGGCRAVLDNLDELARVQGRLARSRPPIRTSDYITNPRPSGYRALHVVVNYDDLPIEVQLRTRVMHEWAIAVERLGGRLRCDLKGLVGPQPLLSFLESVSRALALEESGRLVSAELQKELRLRREEALPYLGGGAE